MGNVELKKDKDKLTIYNLSKHKTMLNILTIFESGFFEVNSVQTSKYKENEVEY